MNRQNLSNVAAWLGCLTLTVASLFPGVTCQAQVQRATYAFPPRSNPYGNSNVRITYGGNIIMDLGNYDVVFGPPLPLGPGLNELVPPEDSGNVVSTSPQIIFKGDTGLRWDGRGYFYHPAYPYDTVARYYYRNRVVRPGEEQYPPLQQDQPKVQRGGIAVSDVQPDARVPFGRITPAPLPGLTADLPEICREYPFAIQCRPGWVQQPEASMPRTFLPPESTAEPPVKPRPTPPSQPSIAIPEPSPIVILCPEGSTVECEYELLSPRGNYARTLPPGQKQVIRPDRDWQIRFDSGGEGVKTYWLRSGKTYRFSKNESGVWQLRWLRKALETSKAAAP